jgi:hypothetical protein
MARAMFPALPHVTASETSMGIGKEHGVISARGTLRLGLLHAELVKGLGEGLGDLGRVPIFNLVPL